MSHVWVNVTFKASEEVKKKLMLIGHVHIMIFIAQSITQQKKKKGKKEKRSNSKKLSARPCLHPPKPIIDVHLQYTLKIAKTHTLYTAYLAHTHINFQLHLHNFELVPHATHCACPGFSVSTAFLHRSVCLSACVIEKKQGRYYNLI